MDWKYVGLHLCLWKSLHSLLHGNCPGKYHDYDCDHNDDDHDYHDHDNFSRLVTWWSSTSSLPCSSPASATWEEVSCRFHHKQKQLKVEKKYFLKHLFNLVRTHGVDLWTNPDCPLVTITIILKSQKPASKASKLFISSTSKSRLSHTKPCQFFCQEYKGHISEP